MDDRAFEVLSDLEAPDALVVIDDVAGKMQSADPPRNINAYLMVCWRGGGGRGGRGEGALGTAACLCAAPPRRGARCGRVPAITAPWGGEGGGGWTRWSEPGLCFAWCP
jgi:hypothetical protein